MLLRVKIVSFIISLLVFDLCGQIYSPYPHNSEPAAYNNKDSVYIYNIPEYGGTITVNIAANSPDSIDGWAFNWFKYNPALFNYEPVVAALSIDTITSPSGYMLIAERDTIKDTSRVWVVFNDFNIHIDRLVAECERIFITSHLDSSKLFYSNPSTNNLHRITLNIPNNTIFRDWDMDNETGSLPSGFLSANVNDPPWQNTIYTLIATDVYGVARSDTITYISKHSKAVISEESGYIQLSDDKYYPAEYAYYYNTKITSEPYPAPAKFKFINNSKNATKWQWIIYYNKDSTVYNTDTVHEFIFPGEYKVKLKSWGNFGYDCIDSVYYDQKIILSESFFGEGEDEKSDSLIFPNVFTPNEDDFNTIFKNFEDSSNITHSNNIFRPVDVSIYDISVIIFNRYGKKVHEYQGNIRNWPGWDGKILNTDRNASEGVYFYVVDLVIGYKLNGENEPVQKEFKKQSGFVHLFREPQN